MELTLLLKSLSGGLVVSCPCCGYQFDYESLPEHTFSQEVRDAAGEWLSWTARNMARQEMEKLTPDIREQVVSIIDSLKGNKESLTEKSITDSLAFVRCPHCYSRVYRGNTILVSETTEQKEKKPDDEEGKKPAGAKPEDEEQKPGKKDETKKKSAEVPTPSPSFWASLSAATKK